MKKLELEIIKYFPIIGNLFFMLIFIESMTGNTYPISTLFDGYFGYALAWSGFLMVLSINRRFCIWHQLLVINMIFNNIITISKPNTLLAFIISSVCAFVFILSIIYIWIYGFRSRN